MACRRKAVVLGAGFAGLWMADRLLDQGLEVELLEQNEQAGGLMETVLHEGLPLDLGPHILLAPGLTHYRRILGSELLSLRGFYAFGCRGKQIPSPLSPVNLLKTLGPFGALPFAAGMAWQRVPGVPPRPPWKNLEELLVARFGRPVVRAFFSDYVPKVSGLPASAVSQDWFLERHRFYQEHNLGSRWLRTAASSCLDALRRKGPPEQGLEIYYPSGGAQRLTDNLCAAIRARGAAVRLGTRVTRIGLDTDRVRFAECRTADGRASKAEGDLFVSTVPLTHLPGLFGGALGPEAEAAARALGWRHLCLYYLQVDQERVSNKIQIYFTEDRYPFKRIYEPKNLIAPPGSEGRTVLCAEICYGGGDGTGELDEAGVREEVLGGVCRFYRVPRERLRFLFSRRVPHAYAVYRLGYRGPLQRMAAALFRIDNFISYGRQGSFRYNHLVDRIIDASEAVVEYVGRSSGRKRDFLGEPRAKSDFF
ncbi:MAG: FAD-dependent oxidoreductase [bacterium]